MAVSLTTKGRLAVKEQGSGWGTAETSFTSTDLIEVVGPVVPPMPRETVSVDTYRPGYTSAPVAPGSKAGGTITFTMWLHGWSATTPSGDPTIHPDATILKNLLGGGGTDGYTTAIAAGSSTSLVNVTNAQADTAWSGFAQMAAGATKNVIWWAKTIDTGASPDTIAPLVTTLAEAPAAGTAYGSYVVWLSTAAATPLTIDWLGTDSTAHIRYFDALPSKATLTLAAKQAPMLEVEFTFLNWTNVGSGGAPADYAYAYPRIPPFIGANGARALFSGGSAICPSTVVIEMMQTLVEVPCASSEQGASMLKDTNRSVTVAVTRTPSDLSTTPWTDSAGSTPAALQIDLANTPGRAASVKMPAPQLKEQPTPTGVNDLIGLTSVYEPLPYEGDTGSTAPADVPFAIGWL